MCGRKVTVKQPLETLESRYCLSSELAPLAGAMHAGGDFARHHHAEFHVASLKGAGGAKVERTTMALASATGEKIFTAMGKRFEPKLGMTSRGYGDHGIRTDGFAGNRADRSSGWSARGLPGGYMPAPPPIFGMRLPLGFVGGIIINIGGNGAAVEAGEATTNVGAGAASVDVAQSGKGKAGAKYTLAATDQTAEQREALPVNPPAEARGLAGKARVAEFFADAEPITASVSILASASLSSTLAVRAADFAAAAAIQSVAADWSDATSFAQIAEKLVSQWLPAADMIVNAPIVSAASKVIVPVMERVASAAMAPTAATYEIVHLGSPFTLLADSLASFVEESATVNNVLAQARPTKPWALTFTVLAADLVVVSYVYRRKKTSRRVALAPIGVA
jgi:hypothetical protein